MSQSKASGAKAETSKAEDNTFDWKEQQRKYAQTAKNMFEKFTTNASFSPKIDHEAIMEGHKKNLEALGDANKMAMEVIKSIAELQGQFVRQTFEDLNKALRDNMSRDPGDKRNIAASADCVRHNIQRAVEHAGKVGEVLKKSGGQIHARLKDHMREQVSSMQERFAKYAKN